MADTELEALYGIQFDLPIPTELYLAIMKAISWKFPDSSIILAEDLLSVRLGQPRPGWWDEDEHNMTREHFARLRSIIRHPAGTMAEMREIADELADEVERKEF